MGIPRYTKKEYQALEKRRNRAKWLTPNGFVTRPMKSKEEQIVGYPPPLSKEQKLMIQNTVWHIDKERSKMAFITRSQAQKHDPDGKPVFQAMVPKIH